MRGQRVKATLGGIDQGWLTTADSARWVSNMRRELGAWARAGGYAPIIPDAQGGPVFSSVSAVLSIFWWTQGERQWLIWEQVESGTVNLVAFVGAGGGSWRTIQSGRHRVLGPWQGTQYAAAKGWCWFVNGVDYPARWDGDSMVRFGYDRAPEPPRVTATTAYDQVLMGYGLPVVTPHRRGLGTEGESWTRGYAVTWVNDLGMESPPSPVVFATGTNPSTNATFAKVVVPDAPANVVGIRLWATRNLFGLADVDTASLYLVDEWGSPEGLVYMDGTPDSELGRLLDTTQLGVVPSGAQYIAFWQGCMWLAVDDQLHYSAPVRVEQFPDGNTFTVGDNDDGSIRGLHPTRDALVVFKERAIFLVKGNPLVGFDIVTLTRSAGAASGNAIVEVPGPAPRVMFVSSTGIHDLQSTLDPSANHPGIGDMQGLRKLWRDVVNTHALVRSCGVYNAQHGEVWFQVPEGNLGRTSLGLVYHLDNGQWSVRRGYEAGCMAVAKDGRDVLFFGTYTTATASGVMEYTLGRLDLNGADLTWEYSSSWVPLGGSPWDSGAATHLDLLLLDLDVRVSASWRRNRNGAVTTPDDAAKSPRDPDASAPDVWGTAVWSTDAVWADVEPVPVRWSLAVACRELSWTVSGSGPVGLVDGSLVVPRKSIGPEVLDGSLSREAP